MHTHTNQQITDPEDEGDEEKMLTQRSSLRDQVLSLPTTNSQGSFQSLLGGRRTRTSTSSSTLWSRVEEVLELLKDN